MNRIHHDDGPSHEEYVNGLHRQNADMRVALQTLIAKADDLISAIDSTTDQFEPETASLSQATSRAERLLAAVPDTAAPTESPKIITLTVEGGLVQDVTGIPEGYALHVEDYDPGDDSHPTWDVEKECFVTVYEGGTL